MMKSTVEDDDEADLKDEIGRILKVFATFPSKMLGDVA